MGEGGGRQLTSESRFWIYAALSCVPLAALATAGILIQWDFGEWLGVFGLLVSVGGFGIALWEIRRTLGAARASLVAVEKTLLGVAASKLGVVILQMRQDIGDLERAIQGNDLKAAGTAFTSWREHAADAETLVRRRFGDENESLPLLADSQATARQAKSDIYANGATVPLHSYLADMEGVIDSLSPLLEKLWPEPEEVSHSVR